MNKHSIPSIDAKFQERDTIISVVIPVFNEEKNIERLLDNVFRTMASSNTDFEVIMVDDGSTDSTVECVIGYRRKQPNTKLIRLSRNFGKEAALNAGITFASGDAVIQLDGDLQHPPELMLEFISQWRKGFDIVYGARKKRDDENLVLRTLKNSFYRVFQVMSDVKLMKGLGDFLIMDRKVVDAMLRLPERERFTKGLYAWVGFSRKAIEFDVLPRTEGSSSWNFFKLFSFAINAITSFGTLPLKVWSYVGLFLAVPSLLYGVFTVVKTLIFGIDIPGYASLIVAICFFSGVQLFGLGIIGEYLGKVLVEAKQRPLFLVSEKVGFGTNKEETNTLGEVASNSVLEHGEISRIQ